MNYIMLDTNTFFEAPMKMRFDIYELTSTVQNIIAESDTIFGSNNYKICLPDICRRELLQQQLDGYHSQLQHYTEEIQNLHRQFGISTTEPFAFLPYISKEQLQHNFDECMAKHKISILPICSKDFFEELLSDALLKKAPFEGKEKKSDKGFKDAVIWHSIIEFAKTHDGTFYFLTYDKIFHEGIRDGVSLEASFLKETGKNIVICDKNTYKKTVSALQEKTDIDSVKIENKIFSKTIPVSTLDANIEIKVEINTPVLKGQSRSIELINQKLSSYTDGIINRIKINNQHPALDVICNGRTECWWKLSFEVTYNNNGIICIVFLLDNHSPGTMRSQLERVVFCLFLKNAKSVPMEHWFKYFANSIPEAKKYIKNQLEKNIQTRKSQKEYGYIVYDDFSLNKVAPITDLKYYIKDDSLIIWFDIYEAGPYSSMFSEFRIPLKTYNI